jgi:hypothetical protein
MEWPYWTSASPQKPYPSSFPPSRDLPPPPSDFPNDQEQSSSGGDDAIEGTWLNIRRLSNVSEDDEDDWSEGPPASGYGTDAYDDGPRKQSLRRCGFRCSRYRLALATLIVLAIAAGGVFIGAIVTKRKDDGPAATSVETNPNTPTTAPTVRVTSSPSVTNSGNGNSTTAGALQATVQLSLDSVEQLLSDEGKEFMGLATLEFLRASNALNDDANTTLQPVSYRSVTVTDQALITGTATAAAIEGPVRTRGQQRQLQRPTSLRVELSVQGVAALADNTTNLSDGAFGSQIATAIATNPEVYRSVLQADGNEVFQNLTTIGVRVAEDILATGVPSSSPMSASESPSILASSNSPTVTSSAVPTNSVSTSPTLVPEPSASPSTLPSVAVAASTPPSLLPVTVAPTNLVVTVSPTAIPQALPASPTTSPSMPGTTAGTPRVCNGVAGLCDVRVNDAVFGMVHNAMSTQPDNFLSFNHEDTLEDALTAGFRGINVDVGICDGQIVLFHAFCFLGTRDVVDTFSNIHNFLTQNPNEVLIVSLQIELVDLQQLANLLGGVPGLTDRFYDHALGADWPTLGELIDAGTNIVLFHYNGPSCDQVVCPPAFLDYFRFVVETEFNFQSLAQIRDQFNSCSLDRGSSGFRNFYGVNVFITLPNAAAADVLNTVGFLNPHIAACEAQTSNQVNLVLVDFWKRGNVLDYVRLRNLQRVAVLN